MELFKKEKITVVVLKILPFLILHSLRNQISKDKLILHYSPTNQNGQHDTEHGPCIHK
jgi:hypothetical protein